MVSFSLSKKSIFERTANEFNLGPNEYEMPVRLAN